MSSEWSYGSSSQRATTELAPIAGGWFAGVKPQGRTAPGVHHPPARTPGAALRPPGLAMRLSCPLCGARDLREFAYRGSAALLARPAADAGAEAWHGYLNLRDNPEGPNAELWQHVGGCRAWLRVVRDTATHAVGEVGLAREAAR